MKININFKKILTTLGLISVFVPSSLSVVACGASKTLENVDSNTVIETINNIEDLKINISENEVTETIFNVLNNVDKGLSIAIAKHDIINFDKNLFKLDTENIYTDIERNNKVKEDQKIELTTYYFQFSYANKTNNAIVPVTITNREREVVTAINHVTYGIGVVLGTTVKKLQEAINFNFIKSSLNSNIQIIFNASLFHLNKIIIAGQEITDEDLNEFGLINAEISYNYGMIENQITTLKISKKLPEVTKEEFIKIAEERSKTDPIVFTIKTKQPGDYNYLPAVLQIMRTAIYTEFLNTYQLRVDITKLKMEDIHSDEMNPVRFSNS